MKTRVVHINKEPWDVRIDRSTIWGNPFILGRDGTRAEVIEKYRQLVLSKPRFVEQIRKELKGKVLACWCKPKACHGDVLAEIANQEDLWDSV